MEQKKKVSLPNRVQLTDLVGPAGMSMFVENLKNNIGLWNISETKQFYQQLLVESQQFQSKLYPNMSFGKFLHSIRNIQGKPQLQEEISR